jgi:hypothetical protein
LLTFYARVFVVTMTQTFMRFLHFHRTDAYVQYLRSDNKEQQESSNACLDVTESEFFALESEEGRKYALCNLLGLVKFWDKQRQKAESYGEESEEESGEESEEQLGEQSEEESGEESEEEPGEESEEESEEEWEEESEEE